jgi:AcrR family transcriptional regulator
VTSTSAPPRTRLLDAAADLFYRYGVTTVGVDAVSAAAGVSKRTLYQHFGSKDELVAAALRTQAPAILARWLPEADDDSSPRAKVLAVFAALHASTVDPGFRGCPFVNVATELADAAHPARAVALATKRILRDYFRRHAAEAGADHPDTLADQLMMLFDGAIAQIVVGLDTDTAAAGRAAAVLLDSAVINPSSVHVERVVGDAVQRGAGDEHPGDR